MTVSVSQFNKDDRELLRKRIETHGGGYSGVLEMDKTTVLVCASPSGDKYMHAKKWNIPCLTSDWVFDSIDNGYCLPYDGYRVERHKANASTPTKDTSREARLAEVSNLEENKILNHLIFYPAGFYVFDNYGPE